ncbi:hypothetical protein FT643_00285 [Ketobacter sp. MCCC 1A13808]|uniref:hypothetical protein n=1 Tax=Ketobacter sp. MCCC 1A13808 TaxID=2602738 RepID=UPI000F11D38B|nr:hypothetical protein [Ketobacter sp. MCCC 1A13808]MVF10570.1 hypothetical protein [Ketobacter sp. MCCC 1A13808]RLP55997.1 MAG: hypothetical protein D6160_00910 [Ketobacter sp.]
MAISVSEDYIRVYRAWNSKEHQVYYPLKINGRYLNEEELLLALEEAQAKDLELAQRQRAHFMRKDLSVERLIHTDGKIVGLKERVRYRSGRKPAHVFEIRVNSEELSKPKFRTISIDRHGYDKAFEMSVDIICKERGLDKHSPIRKIMLESLYVYKGQSPKDGEKILNTRGSEISEMEQALKAHVEAFREKRNVIKG